MENYTSIIFLDRFCTCWQVRLLTQNSPWNPIPIGAVTAVTRFAHSRNILILLVFLYIINLKGPQYDNRISCSSSFGNNFQACYVVASSTRVSRQSSCLATTGLHRSRRALVEWTKHGCSSLLAPGHDLPLEITIYMDISSNPGPATSTTQLFKKKT